MVDNRIKIQIKTSLNFCSIENDYHVMLKEMTASINTYIISLIFDQFSVILNEKKDLETIDRQLKKFHYKTRGEWLRENIRRDYIKYTTEQQMLMNEESIMKNKKLIEDLIKTNGPEVDLFFLNRVDDQVLHTIDNMNIEVNQNTIMLSNSTNHLVLNLESYRLTINEPILVSGQFLPESINFFSKIDGENKLVISWYTIPKDLAQVTHQLKINTKQGFIRKYPIDIDLIIDSPLKRLYNETHSRNTIVDIYKSQLENMDRKATRSMFTLPQEVLEEERQMASLMNSDALNKMIKRTRTYNPLTTSIQEHNENKTNTEID